MRAKMRVVSNSDEIAIAETKARNEASAGNEISVVIPKEEYEFTDLLFDPNNVSLVYTDKYGDIRIIYDGKDLSLEYDKEIFKGLEENFNNRQSN